MTTARVTRQPTHTAISRDGTRIAYDVRGDGPPLVYVTGATCFRRFRPVISDSTTFAKAFTVLTYDRRGRDASGDTPAWALDREVDDIDAMIDALGGQALVYGHSSGAVLALHAAHRLGNKVRGAVLYDAPWVHDEAERERYALLRADVEVLLERGSNAGAIRRFLTGIGMPRVFTAALPLMPGWRTMTDLAPTLRYDMALTADLPPLDLAAQVQVPVQVLVGERSPDSVRQVARALGRALKVEVTTLAKQDHLVSPKALLPILVERFET